MPSVGVLATFRVVPRGDMYPRLFLVGFAHDGALWPFAVAAICQSVNDERYST
jgi:hypothetical protein